MRSHTLSSKALRLALSAAMLTTSLAVVSAQTVSSDFQNRELAANFGNTRPHTVILEGMVEIHSGPDIKSGDVKLTADDNGLSRAIFTLPSETRSEEQSEENGHHSCRVAVGEKANTKLTPNCWLSTAWFFPQITLLEKPEARTHRDDLGEAREGDLRLRALRSQRLSNLKFRNPADSAITSEWSKATVRINPETLLPHSLIYKVHADNGIPRPIDVKVVYSDYSIENGIQVPHHIQRFLSGTLQTDIHIQSVELK